MANALITSEFAIRNDNGVPVVNSRDVAETFGKRHDHVLRDIDGLLHTPNLGDGWFREVRSEHPSVVGRLDRSFDLTRQGFTLLVMGWTGERAMAFKIRYIEAFDAMEAALNSPSTSIAATTEMVVAAVRAGVQETVQHLSVRLIGQDQSIERLETKVDVIVGEIADLKKQVSKGRRNLTDKTKREHIDALALFGGKCPCCGTAQIICDDGTRSAFSQFDHFYDNQHPDAQHTWLICTPCHSDLTRSIASRTERRAEFDAYQNKRQRLPGRQIKLFG